MHMHCIIASSCIIVHCGMYTALKVVKAPPPFLYICLYCFTQMCACGPRKCLIWSQLRAAFFFYFLQLSSLHLMCLLIISSFISIILSSSFPVSLPLGLFSFSSVSTCFPLVSCAAYCCCCVSQLVLILSHFIHWRIQKGVSWSVTRSSLLHCIHLQLLSMKSERNAAASWGGGNMWLHTEIDRGDTGWGVEMIEMTANIILLQEIHFKSGTHLVWKRDGAV